MMRKIAVNWLDPYFVREEELEAAILGKRGKWIRKFKISPGYANGIPGNVDIDFGMPATGREWIIDGIYINYATSAVVANRQIAIFYDPRTDYGQIPWYVLPGPMVASLAYNYFVAPGLDAYNYSVAGGQLGWYAPLPMNRLVDEGLRLTVALGDAGDLWGAVMYYWEYSDI